MYKYNSVELQISRGEYLRVKSPLLVTHRMMQQWYLHTICGENNLCNQACPLLLYNKCRYVWIHLPIRYGFNQCEIKVLARDSEAMGRVRENVHTAYEFAVKNFFSQKGKMSDDWERYNGCKIIEFSALLERLSDFTKIKEL